MHRVTVGTLTLTDSETLLTALLGESPLTELAEACGHLPWPSSTATTAAASWRLTATATRRSGSRLTSLIGSCQQRPKTPSEPGPGCGDFVSQAATPTATSSGSTPTSCATQLITPEPLHPDLDEPRLLGVEDFPGLKPPVLALGPAPGMLDSVAPLPTRRGLYEAMGVPEAARPARIARE